MEIERGLGLVDQRGDVPDVDRLVQVDELAGLPQPVEELAEIFLHGELRRAANMDGAQIAVEMFMSRRPHVERWRPRAGRSRRRDAGFVTVFQAVAGKKYHSNF